jgi:CheY-like chemotaxis protein
LFYQLDNPGCDRSRGVGLGLAIVQRLCELIGATVVVESVVGDGTCFRVSMPAVRKSMRSLLGVWGVSVMTAESPSAADLLFEQHGPPDLMIVDLRLGEEEHGARVADRLQQTYGQFPVLIITGETSSEALRQANERSYTLLQKPIASEVLRRAIVAAVTDASTASTAS